MMGTDFGRTPSVVIGQMRTNGQLRCFETIISDDMGITQFTEEVLKPILINRYRLYSGVRLVNFADPAGGDAGQVDDATCIQIMNKLGIYTIPSPVPRNSFCLGVNVLLACYGLGVMGSQQLFSVQGATLCARGLMAGIIIGK